MHPKGTLLPVSWALAVGLTTFTLRVKYREIDWHDVWQRTLRSPRYLSPVWWYRRHERLIEQELAEIDAFFAQVRGDYGRHDEMLMRGSH